MKKNIKNKIIINILYILKYIIDKMLVHLKLSFTITLSIIIYFLYVLYVNFISKEPIIFLIFFIFIFIGFLGFIYYIFEKHPHKTVSDQIESRELIAAINGCGLIIIGLFVYYAAAYKIGFQPHPSSKWIAFGFCAILLADWGLIKIRVILEMYGINSMEAMEIVEFLTKDQNDKDGSGGRKIFRRKKISPFAEDVNKEELVKVGRIL